MKRDTLKMSFVINYRLLISIIFIIFTSTLLPACDRPKCKQEALILVRKGYFDLQETERHNLTKLVEKDLIESNVVKNTIINLELKKNNQTLSEKDFLKNLKIKIIPNTDVVSFHYSHSDREIKAKIVNTLVNDYTEFTVRKNRKKEEETPESIETQQKIRQYVSLSQEHRQLIDSFEKICEKILCSHDAISDINSTSPEQLIELKSKFDTNKRKITEFIDNNSELLETIYPQSFSSSVDIIQYARYPCPK